MLEPRAAAAVGQSGLMSLYDAMFAQYGVKIAQVRTHIQHLYMYTYYYYMYLVLKVFIHDSTHVLSHVSMMPVRATHTVIYTAFILKLMHRIYVIDPWMLTESYQHTCITVLRQFFINYEFVMKRIYCGVEFRILMHRIKASL